uniref:Glycine cleavage system H protein n=1 Tax=Caligus clemensi TaxID=344056 RepID=C1C1P9_CALCM|nr:Glycine cleavage system H protein, mitochondrial precursor [Caligus clemensi]
MRGLVALLKRSSRSFSVSSKFSQPVFFSEKHEWVDYTPGNEIATVGISDYAQSALGDIVYVQLPEPESEIKMGEECGALESVRAASELYSPISGTVVDKNIAVEDAPSLINSAPESDGWLFKIKLSDASLAQVEQLMNEEKYKAYLESQEEDH